jgi:hypothetical protein
MAELQKQVPGEPQSRSLPNRLLRPIPPKARMATLSGVGVLIALLFYTFLSAGSATLNVLCRSNLRSADVEVSMDGKSIYTDHVAAATHVSTDPKKLFGLLGKRNQTVAKSIAVLAGDHVVQVHLSSFTDKFDETAQREVKLSPGSEGALLVTAERSGMSVVYKPSTTAQPEHSASYSGLLRSMLVMVFGSAVSAAIGFVVTEFLRSKKPA